MPIKKLSPKTIELRKRVVGEFILAARKKQGLSGAALSRALGFAFPGFVSQIEHGTRPIPPEVVAPMARILKVPKTEICARMTETYQQDLIRVVFDK